MNANTPPPDNYIPTPETIDDDGLLVGWSLEHEKHRTRPGFLSSNDQQQPERLQPILYKDAGHLMTIASTGAGKGVGCIIPALLRHQGPVVVIDPKGENYAVTARARREMGQQVVLLDPFNVVENEPDYFNPLDLIINFEGAEIEQCKMLAEMIVIPNPDSKDPFWDQMAEQLIAGLLLYIAASSPPALKNLAELRFILNQSLKDLDFTLKDMLKTKIPEVMTTARAIYGMESKVRASVLSVAQYHTNFMAGNLISAATARTSFELEDVIEGKPLSIYLVIPPDKLDTSSQLIRLWIGSLLNLILMRSSAPRQRTLFILDEAAQMGPLSLLTKAITLLRGYGLQTWSFWQDLSQLQSLYPNWETLYNNCRVHQNFGITNAHFAKKIALITDYIDYQEILKLDNDEMLLQIAGDETVIAQLPNYLTDAVFKGKADENPFHTREDEEALTPQRAQRRYKRRKKEPFIKMTETEALKQELKEAIAAARKATEEAQQAKKELEQLSKKREDFDEKELLELFRQKNKHKKDEQSEPKE